MRRRWKRLLDWWREQTRRWRPGIALACLCVALVACGPPPGPGRGLISEKSYDDPDDWTTTIWVCVSYSTNGTCTGSAPITTYHHDGPHWWLYTSNQKREGWREVSQHVHDSCRLDRWCDVRTGEVIPR